MPTRSSDVAKLHDPESDGVTMGSGKRAAAEETPEPEATVETPEAEAAVETETPTPEAVTEPDSPTDEFADFLTDNRERIDAIDDQILELVARRVEIAGTILTEKHSRGIGPRDKLREQDIFIRQVKAVAAFADKDVNLNQHEIRELFELLIRVGVQNFRRNIIDRRR